MNKNFTKETFKIFWQHAKKYRWLGPIMFFSVVFASIANIMTPLFYKQFFDILAGPGDVFSREPVLIGLLVKILIIYAIGWVFWRGSSFAIAYFENKVMVDLNNSCFAYLHRHSISFFNNTFVGSLVKKVNRFGRAFEGIADIFIFEFLPVFVDLFFVIWILSLRNLTYGLIIAAWAVVYLLINYYFSLYKLKYDFKRSEADSRSTAVLADSITNHQNIKLFNGYEREIGFFKSVNLELKKIRQFCWNLGNIFEALQSVLMIFLEIGIFYFALKLWQKGLATIGDFVLIQSYILTVFNRLWNFGKVIRHYYEHLADANEMTEILQTPHEIQDVKNAMPLTVSAGGIEFKKVTFSYNQTRRVIKDLNLIIKPKEKVGLIGPSGAGKSTIVNLLLRSYDLEYGKILIDGQKVSAVARESLWQNISLMPQDPILFHRSLMENIRYGKPEVTAEQVIAAAKLANAHEFIVNFNEGYDTFVGERGVKLSGGERQRVAIARAILKNAPILLMDEATSSLDSESEYLIQQALSVLMAEKTVIAIAHRLSTIMKMDRIIVLDNGQIVEQGTHAQLLRKNGLYKQLWKRQVGGFIGDAE
ncbi:MAG: ABC transporter ATP-binding protein [Candidatus Komeilibacteria bacterium]|nr:ABC transporter ATP-binding protein [Candidatus Komeilibacteria bacterium]